MKKKLESDLVNIANRILKLKGKEDVMKLHTEVSALYETLTILKFAHENFEGDAPTMGSNSSFFGMLDSAFNNKVSDNIEIEDKIYVNLDENEQGSIVEPAMNKIRDMVAFMPEEDTTEDSLFVPKKNSKKAALNEQAFEDLTADFENMPTFEPLNKAHKDPKNHKKSLNDALKVRVFKIDLNDKIAFIKHLFEGKNQDYERVLSQLNTIGSFQEAKTFIETMVKPDYNHWIDKDTFESRFLELIEAKFN